MTFNVGLAVRIASQDRPRNVADYFEGRQKEQEAFANALQVAPRHRQSLFLFCQGAPGSGKTSFAEHLAKQSAPPVTFISLQQADLASFDALAARVQEAVLNRPGASFALARSWAARALDRASPNLSADIQARASSLAVKGLTFVFHIDEAHALRPESMNVLQDMHVGGLPRSGGANSVVLLTGLQHTERHVSSFPGLTRCGDGGVLSIGALSPDECRASTLRMLKDIQVGDADESRLEEIASLSAEQSLGWPRHLFSVQQAICAELVAAGGNLSLIDHADIIEEAARRCNAYYKMRIGDVKHINGREVAVQQALVEIANKPTPNAPEHIEVMLLNALDQVLPRPPTEASVSEMAKSMINSGLVETVDGLWQLPIPSMAAWAEKQLELGQWI